MKNIVLMCLFVSAVFAKTESDVALTWGYNKFDDPEYLYKHRNYYGIRAGIYHDDSYGLQLGYEYTNSANCIGLRLKRFYTNAVVMTKLENGIKPYGLATLGYETSSADGDYRPSQTFAGLGAGVKYDIDDKFNVFLETRALKSFKTEDVTIATTVGLGYKFDTTPLNEVVEEHTIPQQKKKITLTNVLPAQTIKVAPRAENTYHDNVTSVPRAYFEQVVRPSRGSYFVQVEALTTSSPKPMLRKLHARGVTNASVKKQGATSYVVVGPYESRASATRELTKLKAVSSGAFIKKF